MLPVSHTWSLTAISVAAGIAMLWIFKRFSDQDRVAVAKRKVRANLYAFRLYADEPALIFRAQKQLLLWNARYLALMLRPTAVILVPTTMLMFGLDQMYAHRPLAPGESAIVTAQFNAGSDVRQLAATLDGRGIVVETPSVRIADRGQVCWRIRATGGMPGSAIVRLSGVALVKHVETGASAGFVSERRVSSLLEWMRYPGESLLPGGQVRWIGVSYPAAGIDVFGIAVDWLLWFIAVSLLTMLLARKRFGVSF